MQSRIPIYFLQPPNDSAYQSVTPWSWATAFGTYWLRDGQEHLESACFRAAMVRMNWNAPARIVFIKTRPTCCDTSMKSACERSSDAEKALFGAGLPTSPNRAGSGDPRTAAAMQPGPHLARLKTGVPPTAPPERPDSGVLPSARSSSTSKCPLAVASSTSISFGSPLPSLLPARPPTAVPPPADPAA